MNHVGAAARFRFLLRRSVQNRVSAESLQKGVNLP